MFNPLLSNNAMKRTVKMDFDPEIPRSDDGEKKVTGKATKEASETASAPHDKRFASAAKVAAGKSNPCGPFG